MNNKETKKHGFTGKRIDKIDFLKILESVGDKYHICDTMSSLPPNFRGQRFGHDAIRVEGSKLFIFLVASKLREIFKAESDRIKVEIIMSEIDAIDIVPPLNVEKSHWVCYIRLIQLSEEEKKNLSLIK